MSEIPILFPRHKRFCDALVELYWIYKNNGVERPRVGRAAARVAGYGAESWSSRNTEASADQAYLRLTARADVQAYLAHKGLVKDGRFWKETEPAHSAQDGENPR